jgi:hypothetical protein
VCPSCALIIRVALARALNEWKKIVEHNAGVELAKRERHPIENSREPVTVAGTGGTDGGGVPVSELGDAFIKNYRKLERDFATLPARRRHATTCIPPIVRLRNIGGGWPLGVTILAIVKTVFGVGWNTERRTKAIALYIGAAAKRARIKFDVTHDPGSPCLPTQRPAKI